MRFECVGLASCNFEVFTASPPLLTAKLHVPNVGDLSHRWRQNSEPGEVEQSRTPVTTQKDHAKERSPNGDFGRATKKRAGTQWQRAQRPDDSPFLLAKGLHYSAAEDPQRPDLPQRFTHHCRRTMQIGSVWLRETRNIAKQKRRDRGRPPQPASTTSLSRLGIPSFLHSNSMSRDRNPFGNAGCRGP